MTAFYILLLIVVIVVVFIYYPRWRDQRISQKPFPLTWQKIVERRIAFFNQLTASEQSQLQILIKLFVAKKKFHGCAGLKISDEIRITIAAEACLLILNRKTGVYPSLRHILVYPQAFVAVQQRPNHDGTVSQKKLGVLGQSWSNGKVILSWDDVEFGIANIYDGHNVVLHEFAHQLDSESGSANGAPRLKRNSYQTWAQTFTTEFEVLNKAEERHQKAVMDYYGATNPAEFFAVATETFFEKPEQLASKHPELFQQLKKYYCLDPEKWQNKKIKS